MDDQEQAFVEPKRHRKKLSLDVKLDMIRRFSMGQRCSSIAKSYDLAPSTVGTVLKSADKIIAEAEFSSQFSNDTDLYKITPRRIKKRGPYKKKGVRKTPVSETSTGNGGLEGTEDNQDWTMNDFSTTTHLGANSTNELGDKLYMVDLRNLQHIPNHEVYNKHKATSNTDEEVGIENQDEGQNEANLEVKMEPVDQSLLDVTDALELCNSNYQDDTSEPYPEECSSTKGLRCVKNERICCNATQNREREHPIELFFRSMGQTVMNFPPQLMVETKLKVCTLVTEMELLALKETNPE